MQPAPNSARIRTFWDAAHSGQGLSFSKTRGGADACPGLLDDAPSELSFVTSHPAPSFRAAAFLRPLLALVFCLGLASCRPGPSPAPAEKPVSDKAPEEAAEPEPARKEGQKTLLMHYMPWYETPSVRGQWGSHWKGHQSQHKPDSIGADGQPDIYSHYHPLIGLYDSTDPAAIECHLLQMKLAGIDGVIVDWYGISGTADYPRMHDASRALFDAAGRSGMKFAACFEDRSLELMVNMDKFPSDQVPEQLARTVQWMGTEWFAKPQYFRLGGRPLLLNFGPMYVKDPAVWKAALDSVPDRPAFYALHHLWKNAGGDGGYTWVHWEPWNGYPEEETIKRRLNGTFSEMTVSPQQLIVSACPGFNDVYEQHHRQLEHRDGQTLKEALEVGMEGPWPVIQLVTWNDYGEGTMIEPTHEFGYKFLEVIQQARKQELGDAFKFTPGDLRLPARLYKLRKSGSAPAAGLDRIARLLKKGRCGEARRELDKVDGGAGG